MALTGLTNLQPLHIKTVGIGTFDNAVSIGGTLTYEDVTNVDAIGIITARSGVNVSGGQLDVGSNVKIGNAGIATASNFKTGSSNLHSTGLTVGNALVHSTGVNVGTGATVHSPSTNVLTLGTNSNERVRILANGNITIGTASAAGNKLYFESTSGAAQYISSGGTNNQDLIIGSSAGEFFHITSTGHTLFGGVTTKKDPRNARGITLKGASSGSGISFETLGSNGSRNWRIRPDDLADWGTLEFSVSPTSNSDTDWPDAVTDIVLTLHPDKNITVGNPSFGSGLGQLRIINDAATGSGAPASLSLFGYNNTTTGTVFAKIDFASQEGGTGGQVTAGIEAQAVGTAERAADLVFKTRPDTSGSSAIERVRMSSSGTTTISGVPAFGAISKTASSSTYVDIFVYDTRKDSDGGAWRHRTNNTSWYNETLNTSIRGARREFPQVAIIAVGTSYIHIFDADDPDMPMWMEFPAPSGGARNVMYGPGNPRCVYMLNGILCTGSQAANFWPVLIDFIRDDILGLRSATGHNHYNGRQGNISLRDSATSDNAYWWPDTVANGASQNGRISKRWWFDGVLVSKFVTSVVMDVRPEAPIDKTTGMQIPTIYLGTRGGISIIHSNVGDTGTSYNSGVYDITSNGSAPYSAVGDITITDDGYLWTLHDYFNNSDGGYNLFRDSSAVDLKRLDNQMNDLTHSPSADSYSSLNNQAGGNAQKGREYYWPSTGAEAGTHKIGYSNTWAADILERNAWGCPQGLAFVKKSIYTYDHKESSNFLVRSHANRGLVAMITKDYNTGWHMTGNEVSVAYIADGLTSSISGSAAMLDRGHGTRHLTVSGTLTRAACATGSDLSCVSGFSSSNYARIINASLNAGNPINMTLMGWIKLTDISGYSYLCSIGTGSANMGIAVHASDSAYGGKPYFYDSVHGALRADKGVNDGEWHHICGVFSCSSNRKIFYVDGVRSSGTTAPSNVNYSDLDTIAVGHWCGANGTEVNHSCTGSLALVKLGQTDLTDQQIKRIYEDEKKLFQPNAKAFLYGSSNSVTAIGYDEKKEIYHVGTSSGRSDFSGLSRINNTTTAVTTAISAYDGLIAEQ